MLRNLLKINLRRAFGLILPTALFVSFLMLPSVRIYNGSRLLEAQAVLCTVGYVTLDCADSSGCTYSTTRGYYCLGGSGNGNNLITPTIAPAAPTPTPFINQYPNYLPTPTPTHIPTPTPTMATCNGGPCCTQIQLNTGSVCSTKTTANNCGCPTGWTCNYLGRVNTDGSQTIQCLPPAGGGIPVGSACSPAGAPCADIYVGTSKYEGACIISGQGYICGNSGVPIVTPTATPTHQTPTATPNVVPLSCDANRDGVTNDADYDWWVQELTGQKTTKQADCNQDGIVDILDFNQWRDVYILKQQ